ncbi:MAG: hypothetical protein IT521_11500 [Burkholderiales bacterium]|nr:hypothetical protein [Burkholderiales bacterium]
MVNDFLQRTGKSVPISYITAVWAGMGREDIAAGVRSGSIVAVPTWYADGGEPDGAALGRDALAAESADTTVVDRDRVHDWFFALDPGLAPSIFESIWSGAGADDASRARTLTTYLAQTLLGVAADAQDSTASTTQPDSPAIAAALDAFVAVPAHHARVVDLTRMTGEEIEGVARTDVGVRHALAGMQPFALTGNRSLYAMHNVDGRLDRFDPDSGEALLSDAWLGDRSKFLAWSNARASGADTTIDGSQSWKFIDHGATSPNGGPVMLALEARTGDGVINQVIFGNDAAEVLKGSSGTDRIYGGRGDDVLRGGTGADHLEGGTGDDLLLGGAGADELLGNQGADELDGGAGNDRLVGGSGDDVLAGGSGADHLDGGTGHDIYTVDAGDDNDTIVDADGNGEIVLDGTRIEGTMQGAYGDWRSADGRLEFAFTGDLQRGGSLTIRAFEAGADHQGLPANVVQLNDWKNGDLGITLAGDAASIGAEVANATAYSEAELIEAAAHAVAGAADAAADSTVAATDDGNAEAVQTPNSDFDFDGALSALLGVPPPTTDTLDPFRLQSAINEFSGVAAPPDISAAMWAGSGPSTVGLTLSHLADALASDTTGDDFESEVSAAASVLPPEWLSTDAFALQQEKFSGVQWSVASAKPR